MNDVGRSGPLRTVASICDGVHRTCYSFEKSFGSRRLCWERWSTQSSCQTAKWCGTVSAIRLLEIYKGVNEEAVPFGDFKANMEILWVSN